jgi:hypothetical protein
MTRSRKRRRSGRSMRRKNAAWEMAAAEDESNDDFEWDWNRPDPEEKVTKRKALVESFETLKKTEDVDNETLR